MTSLVMKKIVDAEVCSFDQVSQITYMGEPHNLFAIHYERFKGLVVLETHANEVLYITSTDNRPLTLRREREQNIFIVFIVAI